MVVAGGPLSSVAEALKSVYQLLHRKNQDTLLRIIRPFFQMVLNLMGASTETDPIILSGAVMMEDEELKHAKETKNTKVEYCICLCQAQLAFYLHKFQRARTFIEKCMGLGANEIIISSLDIQVTFLDALSAVAMAWIWDQRKTENVPIGSGKWKNKKQEAVAEEKRLHMIEEKKQNLLRKAEQALAKLQNLARFSPENLNQKVYMVEAELKAINGNIDEAEKLFLKAMKHAEENGAMSDQTLACERAGLALRFFGQEDHALDYLEDCCAIYRQWGALIKVNHLKGCVIPQAVYEWDG
jgi:tetratricopeptide (TPR) repeat protein